MSTLIAKHDNGDLADVEFDFAQVTSVLPNRKAKATGGAAVCIAFRDTLDTDVCEKIGTPFLTLCRRILSYTDLCTRSNRACRSCAWLSGIVRHEWEKTCQWRVQAMGREQAPPCDYHL